jgi:hypothetical protein
MKPKVYIESSVIRYATAKPSTDIIVLAHQRITEEWWSNAISQFDLYVSEIVFREIEQGDKIAAKKRLDIVSGLNNLSLKPEISKLSEILYEELGIPEKSYLDALHLAIASFFEMDYLVTWNCKHIANGFIISKLLKLKETFNFHVPIICTPEELMEVRE